MLQLGANMAALPVSSSPWIPEDDLLLKNAVEAGASLEALAKGAVRFSRKFTVRELQDRWRSLLYDPDASAEASSRMVHLQLSSDYSFPNSRFPSRLLSSGGICSWNGYGRIDNFSNSTIKRKVESIRRIFYAARKKARCSYDGCLHLYDSGCGVNVSDFGLEVKDLDCLPNCIGRDTIADIGDVHIRNTLGDPEAHNLTLPVDVGCSHAVGGDNMAIDYVEDVGASSSGLFDCDFASITDALMNFDSGDDVLEFMDVAGSNVINTCDGDDLSSLLMTTPIDVNIGNETDNAQLHGSVHDPTQQLPIKSEADVNPEGFSGGEADQKGSAPITDQKDALSVSPICASRVECIEEMECVLNTEDPEIPSNDDFVPPKRRPTLRKHVPNLKKEECSTLNYFTNTEAAESSASPTNRFSRIGMSIEGNLVVDTQARLNFKGAEDNLFISQSAEGTSIRDISLSDDEDRFEDEIDVPSFSDVEGMILEMDLCPDESDLLEVVASRYHDEDSKKRIVRLEQSAASFIHRRISSNGAFAVLYGRYLKHYIKETEVILGRATEDMDVDIDLSTEGPANKISRRQALIKLESDGSFLLKNLGKSLMFVNGVEVVTGHSLKLKSSSLIEIRGLAFVFEVNHKSVNNHI